MKSKIAYYLGCCALSLSLPGSVWADEIGLRTSRSTGESITLSLNEAVQATLIWESSETEQLAFSGEPQTVTVKAPRLRIVTDQVVTSLVCSDCGLTELDLTDVVNLQSLDCAGNALTALCPGAAPFLRSLDCSGNQLAELTLKDNRQLRYLNCAGNRLEKLLLSQLAELSTLICADNRLTSLYFSANPLLKTLWCQNNQLTSLKFSDQVTPEQICVYGNQLKDFDLSNQPEVRELWADGNRLSRLDVSSCRLRSLSVSDNELTEISWGEEYDGLEDFYAENNGLMPASLPSVFKRTTGDTLVAFTLTPQRQFVVAEEINMNEPLDISAHTRRNGWGVLTQATTEWKTPSGEVLEKGTDFQIKGNAYVFLRPFAEVYAEISSDYYPGVIFSTAPFRVVDPTGIEDAPADASFRLEVLPGALRVTSSAARQLTVCTPAGVVLVRRNLTPGASVLCPLPKGIYIVNGKKVLLNK